MSLRWRLSLVTALVLLFAWLTAANFIPKVDRLESDWLPDAVERAKRIPQQEREDGKPVS